MTSRFGWSQYSGTRLPNAVYIDGQEVPFINPERALLDVLTQALTAVGYRFHSPGYIEVKTR